MYKHHNFIDAKTHYSANVWYTCMCVCVCVCRSQHGVCLVTLPRVRRMKCTPLWPYERPPSSYSTLLLRRYTVHALHCISTLYFLYFYTVFNLCTYYVLSLCIEVCMCLLLQLGASMKLQSTLRALHNRQMLSRWENIPDARTVTQKKSSLWILYSRKNSLCRIFVIRPWSVFSWSYFVVCPEHVIIYSSLLSTATIRMYRFSWVDILFGALCTRIKPHENFPLYSIIYTLYNYTQ